MADPSTRHCPDLHPGTRLGRQRVIVAAAIAIVVLGGVGLAAGADGALTITPSSGAPGTGYDVNVTCGAPPQIYRRNLQGDPVQGTIAPFPSSEVSLVSPSLWAFHGIAGQYDAQYSAACNGTAAGTGRFNALAPHLWFGPRQNYIGYYPQTTVEGTDCPAGTTATVTITANGTPSTSHAAIDQYGDWSVTLPAPVGTETLRIDATCGNVVYASLTAPTTTTTTTTQVPMQSVPPTVHVPTTTPPPSAPAAPVPAAAAFTG